MEGYDERAGERNGASGTPRWVIFTDLDGTLLDAGTYAFESASGALRRVRERYIPVVFCSSKTRAEQEAYRAQMELSDPFIVENGAAIFIPEGALPRPGIGETHPSGYEVIELGLPASAVRERLAVVRRETGLSFRGYREMTLAEVCRETGLDEEAARRTRACEYGERLILDFDMDAWADFEVALVDQELTGSVAGKYCTVTSAGSDKGKAVACVRELYRAALGPVTTVGIGDSLNDVPLLASVDRAYLVQQPGGNWEAIEVPGLRRVEGVASAGWSRAVEDFLEEGAAAGAAPQRQE